MSPTPSSAMLQFPPAHLRQRVFEILRDGRPVIAIHDEPPGFGLNSPAQLIVADQMHHRLCESDRFIGNDDVVSGRHGEPFGADGRGDHRLSHRHGFEYLQARAASDSQRYDIDGRVSHMRAHVVHPAGDLDAGDVSETFHGRGRRSSNDAECGFRLHLPDARENLTHEVLHPVLVGQPVHRTGEHEMWSAGRTLGHRCEIVRIDSRLNHVRRCLQASG